MSSEGVAVDVVELLEGQKDGNPDSDNHDELLSSPCFGCSSSSPL